MIRTGLFLIAASSLLLTGPAHAQRRKAAVIPVPVQVVPPQCPPATDRYTDWLQSRPGTPAEISPIPKAAVHEVDAAQRARAVALLESAESVELSLAQAREFAVAISEAPAQEGKPFLVRNVVPSFVSLLDGPASLVRVGSALWIRVGLFGCGGFFKNPLVVFLPFTPARVDIQAAAIW